MITDSVPELHKTYPVYHWFPDMLLNATHSSENLAYQLQDFLKSGSNAVKDEALRAFVREKLIGEGLGVHDATEEEINTVVDYSDPWPSSYILADIISRRAQVGWSTHGHSALDVNIYASSPKHAKPLIGNHENTEIGDFIRDYLDLNLESVTGDLNSGLWLEDRSWMGKTLAEEPRTEELDHYHGDFKRGLEGHLH